MNNKNKSNKMLKLYPWYSGLSQGTLFYTAVSTLFLTVVKGFSASQIALAGTISTLLCIVFQKLIINIIRKVGNKNSIILGSVLLLLSVFLATIGNFYIIIVADALELIAYTFKNMENIILKNNLINLNKEEQFMKYKNRAFLVYSISTAIIALIASRLFVINHYLPMILCMIFCFITFIMSFFINDSKIEIKDITKKNLRMSDYIPLTNRLVLSIIIMYGVIRTCIALGFNNTQLFIQYDLQNYFDLTRTTYYLGIIIFASRIVRIMSNISFDTIHNKYKDKLIYWIPISLLFSFVLLLYSHLFISNLLIKFILMGISYGIILFIIDSFTAVIQYLLLSRCDEEKHQSVLTYLTFSFNLFKTIVGLFVSLILLKFQLIHVFIFLISLVIIGIISLRKIYSIIN